MQVIPRLANSRPRAAVASIKAGCLAPLVLGSIFSRLSQALLVGEIPCFQAEGDIDQGNHHRHLDQGTDNRCKGLPGINAENRDGHGNGQLEIVRGGGETECYRLLVGRPGLHGKKERTNITRR